MVYIYAFVIVTLYRNKISSTYFPPSIVLV